jgi:hypothetical protein
MYEVLPAPGWYNPIQSLEVGEAIPFHVAVSVAPEGMLVGVAVRVGPGIVVFWVIASDVLTGKIEVVCAVTE